MYVLSVCFFSYSRGNSATGSNDSHTPQRFFLQESPLLKGNVLCDAEIKSSKEGKEILKIISGSGTRFDFLWGCICLKEGQ